MTDVEKIRKGLSANPRQAFCKAKESGSACVLSGRKVEIVHKDGTRHTIHRMTQARVKVDTSPIAFPK